MRLSGGLEAWGCLLLALSPLDNLPSHCLLLVLLVYGSAAGLDTCFSPVTA